MQHAHAHAHVHVTCACYMCMCMCMHMLTCACYMCMCMCMHMLTCTCVHVHVHVHAHVHVHVCCVMCMLCHVCCLELCPRCCRAFSCTGFVEWFHLSLSCSYNLLGGRSAGFHPPARGLCNSEARKVGLVWAKDAMGVEASRLIAQPRSPQPETRTTAWSQTSRSSLAFWTRGAT